MISYQPQGICPSEIRFDIEDGCVKNLQFINGCLGNLQAMSKLVEGMPVEEVIKKLRGIICQNGTSCADQLVIALEEALRG
ncbi:MAG: TIGR03905 family TSCPD domain-containing protein [Oligoflexia bacterium]|nr:TIGR03905 family TSCPD domain-containing protein [Oligoflexia bacterium]MBF0366952.1 TIGR03905 family TSCPD domain-containing protein [Oligoflexia bacterium]